MYAIHLSAIQTISNKLSERDQLILLGGCNIHTATWYTLDTSILLLPSAQHDFHDGFLDISLS